MLVKGGQGINHSRVSCQKGPTRHAYAWQIGPFGQDTLTLWARPRWPGFVYVPNGCKLHLVLPNGNWVHVYQYAAHMSLVRLRLLKWTIHNMSTNWGRPKVDLCIYQMACYIYVPKLPREKLAARQNGCRVYQYFCQPNHYRDNKFHLHPFVIYANQPFWAVPKLDPH